MQTYKGKSVFEGIAIGRIKVFNKDSQEVERVAVSDVQAEYDRFLAARDVALSQLAELYEKALKEVGEGEAAIFEVHQMMVMDDDFNESIKGIIFNQEVNAEYAVSATGANFAEMFASMDDAYMKERAADVKDISGRIVNILTGSGGTELEGDEQ